MVSSIKGVFSVFLPRFELYPASYFRASDQADKPLTTNGNVRSLGEMALVMPEMPTMHPAIAEGDRHLLKPFVSELMPFMDAYYDHFREVALEHEMAARLLRRFRQWDLSKEAYLERLSLLQAYIIAMLFERVFQNALARHHLFIDLKQRQLAERAAFLDWHRTKRIDEYYYWVELFQKHLDHPFRFEITRPNEHKWLDIEKMQRQDDLKLLQELMNNTQWQRRIFERAVGERWLSSFHRLAEALKQRDLDALFWRLNDIKNLFQKTWQEQLQHSQEFQQMLRQHMIIRANHFPELFETDRADPFMREIKLPNQSSPIERLEQHIRQDRSLHAQWDAAQQEQERADRFFRYTKTNFGYDSEISKQGIITDRQPVHTHYKLEKASENNIQMIDKVNHRSLSVVTYAIEEALEDPNAFQTKRLESSRDREQQRLNFDKDQRDTTSLETQDELKRQQLQVENHVLMIQQLQAGLLYNKTLNEPQQIEDRQHPTKDAKELITRVNKTTKVS